MSDQSDNTDPAPPPRPPEPPTSPTPQHRDAEPGSRPSLPERLQEVSSAPGTVSTTWHYTNALADGSVAGRQADQFPRVQHYDVLARARRARGQGDSLRKPIND
jgi:hypothetical protein